MGRSSLVAALVLAGALAASGPARADADPASDVLYARDAFFPLSARVSAALRQRLQEATRAARRAGHPIKVAVIASRDDLGGVPALFGNPTYYARFLGAELQFLYSGKVLVVMPQGAGLSQNGRLVASSAVVHARIGRGANGLTRSAIELVDELALGKSVPRSELVGPALEPGGGGGVPVWTWIGIAAGVLVVGGGAAFALVRREAARRGGSEGQAP